MRVASALLVVAIVTGGSVAFAVPVSSGGFDGGPAATAPADAFRIAGGGAPDPADPSAATPRTLPGFDDLHDAGVTGEGVDVGVVGGRFAADHEGIREAVAGSRQFAGRSSGSFADANHGTAVAEIVSRTAPDADLYLAGVGADATPAAYGNAVSWLRGQGVDVIVDAGSYFPRSADGMARLNAVAAGAAENGTPFVTSAGNYGDRHWVGQGSEGWLAFANDTRYNSLGEGEIGGRVSLRLYWSGNASYDLYLYRAGGGTDPLVAKSTVETEGAGNHSRAIDATLPRGRYYVAVRGGAGADGTAVELFSSNHDLAISSDAGGMVAPATAEHVIAVGAANAVTGEARPYSSTGPALDISAPDGADTSAAGTVYGSSAAAPLVAGTVSLMIAENESLTPGEAQRVLRATAARSDGRLYLDADDAVRAVSSSTGVGMDHGRPATDTGDAD